MKRLMVIVGMLGCIILWNACRKSDSPAEKPDPVTPPPSTGEDNLSTFRVDNQFTNPVMPGGPDPWVVQKNGTYYYTFTQGSKLVIIETKNVSELASGHRYDVWTPPAGQSYSKNVWAPELHEIDGKWYIYFAADDGTNANHRMYVIENASSSPVQGNWVIKGKISDPSDQWAIDGTVFRYNDQLYMLWSGGNAGSPPQNIYIARMSNPWTISGEKVMIATPVYDWEKKGNPINEGPEVLVNPQGHVFIVYSGSGYWVDGYCLGLLTLKQNGNPMNPADWTKKDQPVFSMRAESSTYGPGHNGFFKSPDGKEDWIIYHARSVANNGSAGRTPRIQRFVWNTDGTPNFGTPTNIAIPQNRPSGETLRYIHPKTKWSVAGFSSEETVNSRLAACLIDNNTATFWIARYSSNPTDYPNHWVTIDMGAVSKVDGFIVNQKEGDRKIKELQLLISNDNTTWENLGVFTLTDFGLRSLYIDLPQRRQFRYFRLVPKSGQDSQKQPALAEVSTFRLKD
ncbi:MAG TPA: family 43 glycosylhydrolase [Niabella sp.]